MGEVYGADDLKLGQRVALKFLTSRHAESASWREQFFAEVRTARQVSHPNVCRVYDVGESDGRLFLSMEFVDGEDLASLLRRIGRLPDDKAIEVAQQLCAGLDAAHRSGVLHRDFKPANVMIDGLGRARITDFGLAIAQQDAAQQSGVAGTPGYLAPELLTGAPASVQTDVYSLGLVLYELFTGRKAFTASSAAEFHRKQLETTPTSPSIVVKNLDPAIERAILRCLEADPALRPRSALSVAAALPGGDPLAAALAAGETPSPEMVAAAGPQGSLRPALAWSLLLAAIACILGNAIFLAPHANDWGRTPMPKSPEVLADHAEDMARSFGYATAVDRDFWTGTDDVVVNAKAHAAKTGSAATPWVSRVNFWYRQSPQWMFPTNAGNQFFASVSRYDPPYETPGMLALKLDVQGRLLFLRGVPPESAPAAATSTAPWPQLFTAAGLDISQFSAASPAWLPPEPFDTRQDWEGRAPGHPDVTLHVAAAALHGVPVYFQVIAPGDPSPRAITTDPSLTANPVGTAVAVAMVLAYVVLTAFFARRNLRRGSGDVRGALRLAVFVTVLTAAGAVPNAHFVPLPAAIGTQFFMLGMPLLSGFLVWLGYIAVEPYARRLWPRLMVSWQRLLGGRFRDPLIGRDVLLGMFWGACAAALFMAANWAFKSPNPFSVDRSFDRGLASAVGFCLDVPAGSCRVVLSALAIVTILSALLRRRWLGVLAAALLFTVSFSPSTPADFVLAFVAVVGFFAVLTGFGLVAAVASEVVWITALATPPLVFSQWYAGRAMLALIFPVALLLYAFYVSLGGQSAFGNPAPEK